MASPNLGLPSTGGNSPRSMPLPGNQGYFSVPTGIQRLAEQGLWSTIRFAAAANVAGFPGRLFATALTQQGQGFANPLSISETNVVTGSFTPGGETYDVTAISAEIYGATSVAPLVTDIRLLQRVAVFQWEFSSQTIIAISPLSMVGSGGGIYGATADTGTPTTFANNGNGGLWVYQNVVVALPATQSWAILMNCGSAGLASGTSLAVTAETQVRVTLFNQSRIAVPVG
jgi:hypothetical protein